MQKKLVSKEGQENGQNICTTKKRILYKKGGLTKNSDSLWYQWVKNKLNSETEKT